MFDAFILEMGLSVFFNVTIMLGTIFPRQMIGVNIFNIEPPHVEYPLSH
jgi:hypothetical protein